jgi:hypothetical protein
MRYGRLAKVALFGMFCALPACSDASSETPSGSGTGSSGGGGGAPPGAGGSVNGAGTGGSGGSQATGGGTNQAGGSTGGAGAGGAPTAGAGGTSAGDGGTAGATGGDGGGGPVSRTPRKLLLHDEGNAKVHYIDLDDSSQDWSAPAGGRDLQLVGNHRLLIAQNDGFSELDLTAKGNSVLTVKLNGLPGVVEAARRLPSGNTVIGGNGGGGVFVWEIGSDGKPVAGRQASLTGVDKLRSFRLDGDASNFVFCSTIEGPNVRTVQRGNWQGNLTELYSFASDHPAAHMFKVIQTAASEVTVATGYGASIVRVDTASNQITKTIGGKSQPQPEGATRGIEPNFYAGFQILANGDYLVTNWQGHGGGNNGKGIQLLQYDPDGNLIWFLDQTEYPQVSSLHNVIALDGIDTSKLNDDRTGPIVPVD